MSCCTGGDVEVERDPYCTHSFMFNAAQNLEIFPIILDIRPRDAYAVRHVHRAVSLPVTTRNVEEAHSLLELFPQTTRDQMTVIQRRSVASPLFIMAETGSDADCRRCEYVMSLFLNESDGYVISIVTGGFAAFTVKYDFMCDALTVRESHLADFRPFPVETVPHSLYLGGIREAMNLQRLQALHIETVINLDKTREESFPDAFHYVTLPAMRRDAKFDDGGGVDADNSDHEGSDNGEGGDRYLHDLDSEEREQAYLTTDTDMDEEREAAHVWAFIRQCFPLLDDAARANKRVLVHCRYGTNRSVALVIAYLMRTQSLTLKQAHAAVLDAKPNIDPDYGLWRVLAYYEYELRQVSTLSATIDVAALFPDQPPIHVGKRGCCIS